MIAILSPAKNMRALPLPQGTALTRPAFESDALLLAGLLREYSPWQLEELMKINPRLALGAYQMFQRFGRDAQESAALLAYHGLAYQNLNAQDFTPADLAFAQEHLRLLSAMYGLLRPLDAIQPYRLEMQCGLKVEGKSLYAHWGGRLYQQLARRGEPIINLASAEYSKAVLPYAGSGDLVVTCDFLTTKRGKLRNLATAAKMARGQMARFLVKKRLESPEELKGFCWEDFAFSPELSSNTHYVFIR